MTSESTMFQKLPNTFILGAAKAGTTTLFETSKPFKGIYLPYSKELEFFSQDRLFAKGIEWYSKTFYQKAKQEPILVDATPHYLYWSEKVAPRIAETYTAPPKFILLLRDPVDRAYSWYWNMVKEGMEDRSFSEAIQMEPQRLKTNWDILFQNGLMTYGYVRGSMYAKRLAPFFRYFPRSSFFFIRYDDLTENLPEVLQDMTSFLDIPFDGNYRDHHAANRSSITHSQALHQWLRQDHHLPMWLKKLVPDTVRYRMKEKIRSFNQRNMTYPPLDDDIGKQLREYFADDVKDLTLMSGVDFSEWLPK